MPVTGVAGSPSLKVSTVGSVHGTPMVCLIRSTTSRAVSGCWAGETVGAKVGASAARTKHRDARMGEETSSSLTTWLVVHAPRAVHASRAHTNSLTPGDHVTDS